MNKINIIQNGAVFSLQGINPRKKNNSTKLFEVDRVRPILPPDVRAVLAKAFPIMKELVLQGGSIMETYRQNKINFDIKSDGSQVTAADKGIQEMFFNRLTKEFPFFRITAEEVLEGKYKLISSLNLTSDFRFVIDPIDGTSHFIDPNKTRFGSTIALMFKNEVIGAVFYAPEFNIDGYYSNRWKGSLFEASELSNEVLLNGKPVYIDSNKNNFTNSPIVLEDVVQDGLNLKDFRKLSGTGSDVLTLSLVASGLNDAPVIMANGGYNGSGGSHLWDMVTGTYFIEKAGGVAWNRNGENVFPLINEASVTTGPIYNGEYFADHPNAIKKLLNLFNI